MTDVMNVLNYICSSDLLIAIIMIGPPGSGKSTLANKIVEQHPDFVKINPDKIREELTGDSLNQKSNSAVFDIAHSRFKEQLDSGYSTIFDATNCYPKYRYEAINVARNSGAFIIGLAYTGPISKCLEYNWKRNLVIPEYAIERMYFSLRKRQPVLAEGYDILIGFGGEEGYFDNEGE